MAYLKVSQAPGSIRWPDRKHFVAYAVQAMRNVLRDHHRKQGRHQTPHQLDGLVEQVEARVDGDLDNFYSALDKFRSIDPVMAHAAELRAMGYSMRTVAELLDIKLRTFERRFTRARARIYELL